MLWFNRWWVSTALATAGKMESRGGRIKRGRQCHQRYRVPWQTLGPWWACQAEAGVTKKMQLLWGMLLGADRKGEVPLFLSFTRIQTPLVSPVRWSKLKATGIGARKNVACKGQNLLPYEAEKNWSKFGSEDREIMFRTLYLGISSLLARGRKVLDQISEEPKYFPILP